MNNLVLKYFEEFENVNVDYDDLKYSEILNLTVDKNNDPAISKVNMGTQTLTKTYDEVSDSDNDRSSVLMGTKTMTFTNTESSDSDRDIRMNLLMVTKTLTESQEVTDSDK